jgi:hypothetical protein
MAKKEGSHSRLVQVAPNEFRSRKSGESDAAVRARYKREQELEARTARARTELDRYDKRRKASDPLSEGVARIGLAIPRELARRRYKEAESELREAQDMKKGGKVKKMAKGGSVSKRADGCCSKGKTKGRFV